MGLLDGILGFLSAGDFVGEITGLAHELSPDWQSAEIVSDAQQRSVGELRRDARRNGITLRDTHFARDGRIIVNVPRHQRRKAEKWAKGAGVELR